MIDHASNPPSFWKTVGILLGTARKRAAGRRKRQSELLQYRGSRTGASWEQLAFLATVLLMIALNILAAFVVREAVSSGRRIEIERQGKIVVSRSFFNGVRSLQTTDEGLSGSSRASLDSSCSSEARDIAEDYGGSQEAIAQKLRHAVEAHGARDLVVKDDVVTSLTGLSGFRGVPALLGSIVLLFWGIMMVTQGEGLELDLQRRRDPMWEWLFSHPVPQSAVFFAEMLSPIAANPIYWGAPLFVAFVYGLVYDAASGFLAFFLIGIPLTIAAACLGKALEIGIVLRFSTRSRGAMLGLMSWMVTPL